MKIEIFLEYLYLWQLYFAKINIDNESQFFLQDALTTFSLVHADRFSRERAKSEKE